MSGSGAGVTMNVLAPGKAGATSAPAPRLADQLPGAGMAACRSATVDDEARGGIFVGCVWPRAGPAAIRPIVQAASINIIDWIVDRRPPTGRRYFECMRFVL